MRETLMELGLPAFQESHQSDRDFGDKLAYFVTSGIVSEKLFLKRPERAFNLDAASTVNPSCISCSSKGVICRRISLGLRRTAKRQRSDHLGHVNCPASPAKLTTFSRPTVRGRQQIDRLKSTHSGLSTPDLNRAANRRRLERLHRSTRDEAEQDQSG